MGALSTETVCTGDPSYAQKDTCIYLEGGLFVVVAIFKQ